MHSTFADGAAEQCTHVITAKKVFLLGLWGSSYLIEIIYNQIIQASDVKIVGEKGTKVPNLSVRELSLVLECHLEATFSWTALDGWQPASKLKLEIIQLEHSISGTSVPVPKTLLKYLLNMLLPALIEARLTAVLAAEVGQYFIDKATPGLQVGGKLNVTGPSLAVLNADLAATSIASAAGVLLLCQLHGLRHIAHMVSLLQSSARWRIALDSFAKHISVNSAQVQSCTVLSQVVNVRTGSTTTKSKKSTRAAGAAAAARGMLDLTSAQCACLDALLCSKHSAVLPQRLTSLSLSSLCQLLAPLAQHPDLLDRWKAALHDACTQVRPPAITSTLLLQSALLSSCKINCCQMLPVYHGDCFARTRQCECRCARHGAYHL